MREPLRVGLTGTVAAGKSTVGDLFEGWGATRVDADRLAREAVAPGTPALDAIRERWGEDVLSGGALDRDAMRRIAFADDAARRELEAIVHAGVRRLREAWRERAALEGATILVEEIPLLLERGLADDYDAIVVVDAPVEVRCERAGRSRGWSPEEFQRIDASQLPSSEKRAAADFVIDNAGDLPALEEKAAAVWRALEGRAASTPGRRGGEPRPGHADVDGGPAQA